VSRDDGEPVRPSHQRLDAFSVPAPIPVAPRAPGRRSSPLVELRRRERCPHDVRTLANGILFPRRQTL